MNKSLFAAVILFSTAGLAEPNKIVDSEWAIDARGTGQLITLQVATPVKVVVEGLRDAKKGFTVRILPGSVYQAYLDGKVTSLALDDYPHSVQLLYSQTLQFDAGAWAIVVQNTENAFKSLTVRVKIIVDPKHVD